MQFKHSQQLFSEAEKHLVGGVNSPVRAFRSVGGNPLFIEKGDGANITDVDGNMYIDYVGSYGPLILGHNHPEIVEALQQAIQKGTSFGASTEMEIELAKLVKEAFPSIELVRFVNSGTEAVMSAIRLARGFSGKNKIIKFSGCYHGHSDYLLAKAGSGVLTYGLPGSAGVPANTVNDTLVVDYNNIEAVKEAFEQNEGEIAAVIIEPVAGNMGVVLPREGFLQELRQLTLQHDALLIFDEVMCGFRNGFGGAQTTWKVNPDITCLGKIIGGGLPVGAYGARKEIMEKVSPMGPVYQAGTLSGNPLAMTAGVAMLRHLRDNEMAYDTLNRITTELEKGMLSIAKEKGVELQVNRYGSMINPFFTSSKVTDYNSAQTSDIDSFTRFFWKITHKGIFIPPSQFEAWFISMQHSMWHVDKTLEAIESAF